MDFENYIGADFDNVSQRLVYNYIATQPDFRSIPTVYRGKLAKMCYYFKYIHTRELTHDILEAATALYAWVDNHYEVAT